MQFTSGDKREVYLLDESALPVNEKERRREGKRSICPRMKYGRTNHISVPHTTFIYHKQTSLVGDDHKELKRHKVNFSMYFFK